MKIDFTSVFDSRLLFVFAITLAIVAFSFVAPVSAQVPDEGRDEPLLEQVFSDTSSEFESGLTKRIIQLFLAITVLSLAPGLAMMVTCLPFMLIVLSILRQGTGLQQAPPNMLIVSVAMFLTAYVMEPIFKEAWINGYEPLVQGKINEEVAFQRILSPLKKFMLARVDERALEMLYEAKGGGEEFDKQNPKLSLLVPSFVLSEIQHAFRLGFIILLPFLVIDLLIASILMAMGMLMLPPAIVSLPFKVAFFVISNAWVSVGAALVRGYGV